EALPGPCRGWWESGTDDLENPDPSSVRVTRSRPEEGHLDRGPRTLALHVSVDTGAALRAPRRVVDDQPGVAGQCRRHPGLHLDRDAVGSHVEQGGCGAGGPAAAVRGEQHDLLAALVQLAQQERATRRLRACADLDLECGPAVDE